MKPGHIFIRYMLCLLAVIACPDGQAVKTLRPPDLLELSNNSILCMHQDRNGDMWFGSYDGLNLFNGKNTFVYRYDPDNPFSISGNIIQRIIDADADHLWISTFMGVDRFSLKERKVVASYLQYPESRLITADASGSTLLISLTNFISYYSPAIGDFQDIFISGIHPDKVKALFTDQQNHFYLFTENGLLRRIRINDSDMPVTLKFEEDLAVHDRDVVKAFYDNGCLYYVDIMNKLYTYDCTSKKRVYVADLSEIEGIKGEISQIESWDTELYISLKNNGVVRINQSEKTVSDLIYSDVGVFCMCKDRRQDILWLGTDGQGVQMFYNKEEMFGSILLRHLPYYALKPVRAIYTDEKGDLWFGTKGNGVFRIADYATSSLDEAVINYQTEQGLSDNQVFCFHRSQYWNNILWIGTEGPGLSYYSYTDHKVHTLPQQIAQNIRRVHSICEVNDSVLWLATAGDGLLEVTIQKVDNQLVVKKIEVYTFQRSGRMCNEFHSMIFDGKAMLYIGSRGGYGVIKFNINSKDFEFLSLSNVESAAVGDVLSVHLSVDSFFYFGASSGLTKMPFFSSEDQSIIHFDRKKGLANDMIHGILEDDLGCLWLSTNKGITKYNPQNDFFHNYYSDLLVTEFADDAYWKCPYTSRLFFGGINGLVWVEAGEHMIEQYSPKLRFWDLEIQGERSGLAGFTDKIVIPAQTNSFTVSFVATDFINGANYEYSYSLDDYGDSWIELQKNNEITLLNLPSGKYILRVKYKNDVYESNSMEYIIPIIVLPPWYWTWWAIFVYVLCALLLICIIFRFIQKRIRNQQREVARRIKEEQLEKTYESKLNFFTNITHELFTPLTLINGVAGQLQSEFQEKQNLEFRKYLDILRKNVSHLNELIQEIIDFRRIEENGIIHASIRNVNVSDLLHAQVDSFSSVAERDHIQFRLDVPDEIYWNTDVLSIKRIVSNLVSNAFKYTEKEGQIRVTLAIQDANLVLKVYNTGAGIAPAKIHAVFDRYRVLENMEENKYMQMTARNGLGLFICYSLVQSLHGTIEIVSEVNEYAEVIVTLPSFEIDAQPVEQARENMVLDNTAPVLDESVRHEQVGKPVILVVDDHEDVIWFVSNILSKTYQVVTACDASGALTAIAQHHPLLIITDIIMPHLDGLELIRQIKQDKFTRHIPIVIISAKITEQEQAEGLNAGADAYLTKPFSSVILQSTINRLLSNRKALEVYYYSPESAFEYAGGQLVHKEDKAFMDKLVQIIRDNISEENLRPELIAEQLGLNTRNLYRRVKKVSALSPSDFIKDYRFIYAAQLLISTNLSIQEVIYKVGITNKSYFYREFAKKYQMTPKAYRSGK